MIREKSWILDLSVLFLVLTVFYFLFLGTRPLFTPDEGRYAEIAREMAANGNYITPFLNGIKYFEKPVLFYWLAVFAIKIGGLNLWSIRSVNAILGLIGVIATYASARTLYDRVTGLFAALILSTSVLYFTMSHMVSLDLTVTVFQELTLFAFLIGEKNIDSAKSKIYFLIAAFSMGLAVLTKGLIGIVFPIIIVALWLSFTKNWKQIRKFNIPLCVLIFLLTVVPWHLAVGIKNPEFFYFYFIEQHFLRYTMSGVGHDQPIWFFVPFLFLGLFPWSAFLIQTFWTLIKNKIQKYDLFFIIWTVFIFAFFSFSKSKLIPYILPIFPPLAILVARYFHIVLRQGLTFGLKLGYGLLVIFSVVLLLSVQKFLNTTVLPDTYQSQVFLYSGTLMLLFGMVINFVLASKFTKQTFYITIISMFLFLLNCLIAIPYIDTRTVKPLANLIKPMASKYEIYSYNQYYQDLPFYLQTRVNIVNWRNELSYGMRFQDTNDWMINDREFWKRWQGTKRMFVIMDKKEFAKIKSSQTDYHFYPLAQTTTNILLSNRAS